MALIVFVALVAPALVVVAIFVIIVVVALVVLALVRAVALVVSILNQFDCNNSLLSLQ